MKSENKLSGFQRGFSLVELLVVMTIIGILSAMSGPLISSLTGAGTVNKAIFDFSGTLQVARAYAMANDTYVRVAISETSDHSQVVVLPLYSADGTLSAGSANPAAGDMADPALWPAMSKPLTLENLGIFNAINAASPATASDALPSDSAAGFSRTLAGAAIAFQWVIQFTPSGEAAVLTSYSATPAPARYIKIAMDRPAPANTSIPLSSLNSSAPQKQFILRLSGVNGSVSILRKGEGI